MHAVLRSTSELALVRIVKTKGARPEEVASPLTYVVLHSPHLHTGPKAASYPRVRACWWKNITGMWSIRVTSAWIDPGPGFRYHLESQLTRG
jgi:hypothetical protein